MKSIYSAFKYIAISAWLVGGTSAAAQTTSPDQEQLNRIEAKIDALQASLTALHQKVDYLHRGQTAEVILPMDQFPNAKAEQTCTALGYSRGTWYIADARSPDQADRDANRPNTVVLIVTCSS